MKQDNTEFTNTSGEKSNVQYLPTQKMEKKEKETNYKST